MHKNRIFQYVRMLVGGREKSSLVSIIAITFAALLWLLIRSSTRPERLRYPCQRASLSIVLVGVPLIGSLIGGHTILHRMGKRKLGLLLLGIAAATAGGFFLANSSPLNLLGFGAGPGAIYAQNKTLSLTELDSPDPTSTVYVAQGKNAAYSLDSLLSLLQEKGVSLYETHQKEGIIGREDTVLIKVNGEWEERGGTNTDLLKAFIQKIIEHPEGFAGEVVVVENGQWAIYLNSNRSNAEDRTQSFQEVVDYFQGKGYRVCLYDWTQIGGTAGDIIVIDEEETKRDGYVDMPGGVSYPVFTTKFGTRISLRDGIFKNGKYHKSHLTFINMPVLKAHSLMGVTAATKHYMGVLSTSLCNDGFDQHEGMVYEGLMGRMMAQVIYPHLNILDANYIGVSPNGPASSYESAYQAHLVLASTDPIALDYYAGKYVLYPLTEYQRHHPDNQNTSPHGRYPYNAFHQYLKTSAEELEEGGYQVTTDETKIQAFVAAAGNI